MRTVADRDINAVGIVDDDPEARGSYEWTLEDAALQPVEEAGPLGELHDYAAGAAARLDAVLCDQHLRVHNYAKFDGAQLAAALYERDVPAVLCTRWGPAHLDLIRPYRDRVPALVRWDDLHPDRFIQALELTIRELRGDFTQQRRPWRTQVHIADVGVDDQQEFFYVDLPAWTSDEVIRLRKADLPAGLREQLRPDARWHAQANIGAEDASELYFRDWEGVTGATITILDVGHGSCVLLASGNDVTVVDTGAGATLLEYLRSPRSAGAPGRAWSRRTRPERPADRVEYAVHSCTSDGRR
jgi:hypothetical protein